MDNPIDSELEAKRLKKRLQQAAYRAKIAGPEARAKAAEQARKWRVANLEHVRAYNRAYEAAHPEERAEHYRGRNQRRMERDPVGTREKYAAHMANWRAGNPEKHAAACQRWREKHYEAFRQYCAEYYRKNPEAVKSRNAQRRGAEGYYSRDDIIRIGEEQNGFCIYCDADLTLGFEIDHKTPISRGGTNWPDNIQLLCSPCNNRKRAKTDAEYRALLANGNQQLYP